MTALTCRWRHWTKTTGRFAHKLVARWQAGASPRRAIVLQATGMWLATRVLLLLTTYFALTLSLFNTRQLSPQDLLTAWDKFDTVWYLNISQFGYWLPSPATFARDHGQIPTAFFPLYPLLIATISQLIGTAHRLAGALIISNLGTLAAFIGIGLFAANEDGDEAASRTIRLVAAYPLAFFLMAAYTEGVFLALAVFCLYFVRRHLWYAAAICAFFAALTRFTGVILFPPLVYEYGSAQGWWRRSSLNSLITLRRYLPLRPHLHQLLEAMAVILSVPLGLGTYMLYLGMQFHNPLSFAEAAEVSWLHHSTPPWQSLPLALHQLFTTPPWTYQQALVLLDLIPLLAFLVITLATIRHQPTTFTLYMLGLLTLIVVSPVTWTPDTFVSAGRYLIPAVPIFLLLARWSLRRPGLDILLVGGFLLQGALLTLWLTTPAYIT
jgi:Gpi18-like mannosyltransferase